MSTSWRSTSSRRARSPRFSLTVTRPYSAGIAQAVDARDRGHDQHVAAAQQRRRGRQAQPVDLLVDLRVLLDVGVGARKVGFGLVVVVVADEVLDRVVREELLELAVELGGQRLVVRHHQRRAVDSLDDLGHDVGLAGAGRAQKRLVSIVLACRPSRSMAMASGWSPVGWKSETSLKSGMMASGWPHRTEVRQPALYSEAFCLSTDDGGRERNRYPWAYRISEIG